jgi:hypothetical protein
MQQSHNEMETQATHNHNLINLSSDDNVVANLGREKGKRTSKLDQLAEFLARL